MTAYAPTARSRGKRLHERVHYDHETVYRILDAGLIAHVGYIVGDQPYVTPTCYWRDGNRLYWHGSSASRALRRLGAGVRACVTVTHFDGLVLARSGFHSSINYRSVMAFGRARPVDAPAEKLRQLEAFVERMTPGRWAELRPPTAQELRATTVVSMEIEEASAKWRTGPPKDDEEDYALDIWAGVLPIVTAPGGPARDPRLKPDIAAPDYLKTFAAW